MGACVMWYGTLMLCHTCHWVGDVTDATSSGGRSELLDRNRCALSSKPSSWTWNQLMFYFFILQTRFSFKFLLELWSTFKTTWSNHDSRHVSTLFRAFGRSWDLGVCRGISVEEVGGNVSGQQTKTNTHSHMDNGGIFRQQGIDSSPTTTLKTFLTASRTTIKELLLLV